MRSIAVVGVAPAAYPAVAQMVDGDKNHALVHPGHFRVDPFWPKPLPKDPSTGKYWVTGEVAGTDLDSRDHLFTINRRNLTPTEQREAAPSPAFIVYDRDGGVANSATPPVLPDGLHGVFVDFEDNVWIGGNADAIVQKYSHDLGTLLLQIGEKGHFDSSDGTATGTPLNKSHTLLNKPADVAVDPENGEVYIADGYGNHRVVVFDKSGKYLRQWGELATLAEARRGVGGKFLKTVHAVNLGKDGLVYVNDRGGDRVQVFEKDGHFVRNIWINKGVGFGNPDNPGTAWDIDFSRHDQRLIYVSDGEEQLVWTVGRRSGRTLTSFGQPGHMAGQFTFVHTLATDSKGDLYTGETIGGRRVQKFRTLGHY
ncbi:MAG: hypothetical protein ACRDQA_26965 [Nocardioidaceae bacterium]